MWSRKLQQVWIVAGPTPPHGLRPSFLNQPDIRVTELRYAEPVFVLARSERPRVIVAATCGDDAAAAADLCRRIKAHRSTRPIPVVLVASAERCPQAESAGADAVVATPILLRRYFESLREFVALPQRRKPRHLANLRFTFSVGERVGQAFTRDLSAYGAFLKTDWAVEPGTRVGVSFLIPGHPEELRCQAIVRSASSSDPQAQRPGGFGVEFEGLSDEEVERLEEFVRRQTARSVFRR